MFLREVSRLKVRTATYFSLMLSKELLKTPIPTDILRNLEPESMEKKASDKMANPHRIVFSRRKKVDNLGLHMLRFISLRRF